MIIDFNKIDYDRMNSAQAVINAYNDREKQEQKCRKAIQDVVVKNPMNEKLQTVIEETQKQNGILQQQIELLKEENERQKEEVKIARQQEEKALREAKRSRRDFWISTGIAIASFVVSAVSHFI